MTKSYKKNSMFFTIFGKSKKKQNKTTQKQKQTNKQTSVVGKGSKICIHYPAILVSIL